MSEDLITYYQMPQLNSPVLMVAFGGWSNAGNTAIKTIEYIIRKKRATLLAELDPDSFFQYTQNRPVITIKEGKLRDVRLSKTSFYFFFNEEGDHDLILAKGQEPDYRWQSFVDMLVQVCKQWDVFLIVSLGGMYDDVLHTESIVSGVYSDVAWGEAFAKNDVGLIDYEGPSGIHSLIMHKAQQMRYPFVGLWGHSPLYLRGTNFRVVMRMLDLLRSFFGFSVDTDELKTAQGEFEQQIGTILESNEELREHIEQIKKIRNGEPRKKDGPKVVHIEDFMRPRHPE